MSNEDLVELQFQLYDESYLGPFRYSSTSTIAMLKERIVAEWPKDKKGAPMAANEVKLIYAGKILENSWTVGRCKTPFNDELANGIITMHAVVQPPAAGSDQYLGGEKSLWFSRADSEGRVCRKAMLLGLAEISIVPPDKRDGFAPDSVKQKWRISAGDALDNIVLGYQFLYGGQTEEDVKMPLALLRK